MPRRAPFDGPLAEKIVQEMADCIRHRGPDGDGVWRDPQGRAVLGQKRLAIIDTSDAGLQPFVSGNGRWWITFNGEIYNFQELRSSLEAAGVHLRGRTDTEVLLEGVALYGADWLSRLDGMFAFAAFDTLTGETLIARDPFGEKPLYYMELAGRGLAFASELQAIEKVPGFDGTVNVDAMAEMLTFQYIGAPRTIYAAVKKLPPGCWMRISSDGEIEIKRYFRFDPGHDLFENRSMASLADELEEILVRSLRGRLIADVPLGAFLSGGVDSSTVCALIRRRLDTPLKTFSIGFKGAPESEHETARLFARHLGTEHHEEIVQPNSADFLLGIGGLQDEPNADSSCLPTYMLSQFCRKHVTVAISGDGGDEMFGGYGRYFATLEEQSRYDDGLVSNWRPGDTYYASRILVSQEPHLQELMGFVPQDFGRFVTGLREDMNQRRPGLLAAMRRHDVEHYLPGAVIPKVDRMSMRHSLEVRTPFLNVELARFAERLPDDMMIRNGRGKLVLKEVAYRYLPRELIDLPKQGFALPMSDWARNALLDTATRLLDTDDSRIASGFGKAGVSKFLDRQRSAGGFSAYQVWAVATMESWLRHHPAVLPDVRRLQVSPKTRHAPKVKLAHPIRAGLYAIGTISKADLASEIAVPVVIPTLLVNYLVESAKECGPLHGAPQPVPFADLSKPLSVGDQTRLERMAGGTAVLLDTDDVAKLDFAAIGRLRSLGIAKLAYVDLHSDDRIIELSFRSNKGGLGRLANLWFKRVGTFSNRRLARRFAGAKPIRSGPGFRLESGALGAVNPIPDKELSGRYALFEGGRQLPPLHCSHAEIEAHGGGRYSVYNQEVLFSATETERRYRVPYWLVPVTAETAPLLEIVQRSIPGSELVPTATPRVERFFQPTDGKGFRLSPGDHIAVCTHALPPGGAERQWVYLAQGLKALGYRVTFITFRSTEGTNGHYLPQLSRAGIEHVNAGDVAFRDLIATTPDMRALYDIMVLFGRHCPRSVLSAMQVLQTVAPKAVIAQLDEPNLVFAAAARALGIGRTVVSFRNHNPSNFDYLMQDWFLPVYRMIARSGAVRFTGNFQGAVDDYADWIGIDRSRMVTIANAIDADFFAGPLKARSVLRSELGVAIDAPTVLGVFRLSAEKAPLDFVEVARRVAAAVPGVRFLIAGIGPMRVKIEEKIDELGLGDVVKLLGRRDDVPALLGAADMMLLTSRLEGMPNVVLEAQFGGLPVVATDAGASGQIVADGETGYIRGIGDVEALADRCIALLRDPDLRSRMSAAAKARIGQEHSKEMLAQRYVDVLNAMI
jgi:asparagine synthase (glutamine-hydrolysing)